MWFLNPPSCHLQELRARYLWPSRTPQTSSVKNAAVAVHPSTTPRSKVGVVKSGLSHVYHHSGITGLFGWFGLFLVLVTVACPCVAAVVVMAYSTSDTFGLSLRSWDRERWIYWSVVGLGRWYGLFRLRAVKVQENKRRPTTCAGPRQDGDSRGLETAQGVTGYCGATSASSGFSQQNVPSSISAV